MIDGHIHLENGPHTVEYVLEFVKQAEIMGIKTIHILDHTHRFVEFKPIYEELNVIPQQKKWLENKNLEPISSFHNLAEKVKKLDIGVDVRFGLEVCYVPKHREYIANELSKYNYDFVIGSVHSIENRLYDMTFSNEILWDKFDTDYIYKKYYEIVFDLVGSGIFTQLGHCDNLKISGCNPSYDLTKTYEQLAQLLNKNNMYAENNTGCRYRYNHKDIGLSKEFLDILKANKVKLITSSDAHYPEHVGMCIKEIYNNTMNL
ncbi:MAG: PHP domain-containing protein [Clostridia bacterium]